ncbi:unnamed protein product [Polarella glacialis]|uniref:Uncharacterized protein n=1 Tax=Polarella glacialis TaxID=89957 RepID=A0A813FLW1_POLGL|nr:unnamed protein product [Polarella glacialis]
MKLYQPWGLQLNSPAEGLSPAGLSATCVSLHHCRRQLSICQVQKCSLTQPVHPLGWAGLWDLTRSMPFAGPRQAVVAWALHGSGTTFSADLLKNLTWGSHCRRQRASLNQLTSFRPFKASGQVTSVTQCDALNYQDHA